VIERQDAVRTVVHDADDGTIVLRYDTRKAPESLLRGAVMDRLLAMRKDAGNRRQARRSEDRARKYRGA